MNFIVTLNERSDRLSICKQCPHISTATRCSQCGCFMAAKTWLSNERCPLGKWIEIKKDET